MPNGFTKVDTLEYAMANPDGTLLGNGFTDIKESKLFYKEDVKFRGKYKVHIKQAVRQSGKIPGVEELEGVTDVGFRIEQKD
ncbi:Gliding motility lipoprotein GldH precursor [compost metagenome]